MTLTLLQAWTRARRTLEASGADSPVLDARAFLEIAAGVARIEILTDPHRPLPEGAADRLDAMVARRAAGEPAAYVTGRKGFWKIELAVTPAVLVPRPETEALVQAAIGLFGARARPRILDLGVGSGAILLALLAERFDASGLGVDASADALAVAQANVDALGLSARADLRLGDWGEGLEGPFDLIVSNPPYIETDAIGGLAREVQAEPRLALDGGPDGLDAYRRLAPDVARLLSPGGAFAVEVGAGQAAAVAALMAARGLTIGAALKDLNGVERVVMGVKP